MLSTEYVTNTDKKTVKLSNLQVNVTQATVLHRTSPPTHGTPMSSKGEPDVILLAMYLN